MKNEPAITVASITAVIAAALALLASFGLNLSNDQRNAVIGFVAVVAPLVAGLITRTKVTPAAAPEHRAG